VGRTGLVGSDSGFEPAALTKMQEDHREIPVIFLLSCKNRKLKYTICNAQ
jgi:hypothetical protein